MRLPPPCVEEYTLVSIADYLFSYYAEKAQKEGKKVAEVIKPYNFVSCSNLSSSRALRDVTEKYGGRYEAAAVGEVNVTTKMRAEGALIGGEGNGGVIYPALHYGRDAMVGVALFLSNLAHKGMKVSELKKTYPEYHISKNKIQLPEGKSQEENDKLIDTILTQMKQTYKDENINDIDGVKIIFEEKKQWVHLRKSNTEPIIRIYSEAATEAEADELGKKIIELAKTFI